MVLYAGRISAEDKVDLVPFLRVFADLAKTRPNLRLVLAGSSRGDEMRVLGGVARDLGIAPRVTALGLVARDLLPALYSAADVFLSLADSLPETFGFTVVEAMACGVPVVASDWDGYRDTVVHGETGFLVDTVLGDLSLAEELADWSVPGGDLLDCYAAAQATVVRMGRPMDVSGRDPGVRSVLGALSALLDNPDLRSKMGDAGRARVVERYAWPVVVRQYDDLVDELRKVPSEGVFERGVDYERAHLQDAFSGYATGALGDETRVRAADGVFASTFPGIRNARLHLGIVRVETAKEILDALREPREGVAVGDVARRVDLPHVRFHVAWLLKQGYVEVVASHNSLDVSG